MRPIIYTLGVHTGVAAAAIAALQATAPNVPLILTSTPFVQDVPRTVTFTSGADVSNVRFSIRGIGPSGNEVYDTVIGPNIGLTESVQVFKEVLSITPNASTGASTVSAGQSATVPSPWFPLSYLIPDAPVAVSLFVPTGGLGVNATVELGMDQLGYSVEKHSNHHGSVFDIVHPAIESLTPVTAITIAAAGNTAENLLPGPATAMRFVNTGPITVGLVTMRALQGHAAVAV